MTDLAKEVAVSLMQAVERSEHIQRVVAGELVGWQDLLSMKGRIY